MQHGIIVFIYLGWVYRRTDFSFSYKIDHMNRMDIIWRHVNILNPLLTYQWQM